MCAICSAVAPIRSERRAHICRMCSVPKTNQNGIICENKMLKLMSQTHKFINTYFHDDDKEKGLKNKICVNNTRVRALSIEFSSRCEWNDVFFASREMGKKNQRLHGPWILFSRFLLCHLDSFSFFSFSCNERAQLTIKYIAMLLLFFKIYGGPFKRFAFSVYRLPFLATVDDEWCRRVVMLLRIVWKKNLYKIQL